MKSGTQITHRRYWDVVLDIQPLCNEAHDADTVELECCFTNEAVEDKDGYVQIATYCDKENTTPDGIHVIQRFQKSDADALVNEFKAAKKSEEDAFAGVPIYKGHPDRDGTIKRRSMAPKLGKTMDIQAREDGLYATRLFNSAGQKELKAGGLKYPSTNWFAKAVGSENGKLIMRPVELISWGMTPNPNLAVKPLVNSAIVEKFLHNCQCPNCHKDQSEGMMENRKCEDCGMAYPEDFKPMVNQTKEQSPGGKTATTTGEKMDKLKLIALLASVGVTLANDTPEQDVEKKVEEVFGKVKTLTGSESTLTNEKTELEKKVKAAEDKATELQTSLSNSQNVSETTHKELAKTSEKLGVVEKELATLKTEKTVSETVLANEKTERGKASDQANKLQSELVESKTNHNIAVTTLTNEQKAHEVTKGSLSNAKKAIVNLCITTGKILPSERAKLEAMLTNEVEFGSICDQLGKSAPRIKMVPILSNVKQAEQDVANPANQFKLLVNENLNKKNILPEKATRAQKDQAWEEVKSSAQGKVLLGLMHQPESGIPVATR